MTLTKEHPDLERIIVSDSTLSFVHQLIPKDIQEEIVDKIDKSEEKVSEEDEIKLILETLESRRKKTVILMNRLDHLETKADDSKPSFKKQNVNNVSAFKNHDCQKSSQCRPEWDILGFIMLYKLKKIAERLKLMKENQLCFKCGSSFKRIKNKTHLCFGKMERTMPDVQPSSVGLLQQRVSTI